MSELNYKINYTSMIDALQMGGTAGLESLRSSRTTRGLGTKLDTEKYVEDEEKPSLQKRILNKMDAVKKENESMAEKMKALGVEKDPVTGELVRTDPPPEKPIQPLKNKDIKTSGDIAEFIKSFENFSSQAYDDYGRLSIGYGTKASNINQTITEEEARNIVLKANKEHGYNWPQHKIDALTSFTYNAGAGNFKRLIEGDDGGIRGDEEIATMITEYNTAGGKVLPGLTKRREAELKLFEEGYD
jgi:lysozyme